MLLNQKFKVPSSEFIGKSHFKSALKVLRPGRSWYLRRTETLILEFKFINSWL